MAVPGFLLPGFTYAHAHFDNLGEKLVSLNMPNARSFRELVVMGPDI